jgi:hypothetical protein
MIAGNVPFLPAPLVPGRRRERGWKMPRSGLWRYPDIRVSTEPIFQKSLLQER